MTKRRFHYDTERREQAFRRRLKLLNRVQRGEAEAAVAWLRSGMRLSADDRAEIASLIDAMLLRGRQPGRASSPYGDRKDRVARDVYERREAQKAAAGRKRMPGAELRELAEKAISDDYERHPFDRSKEPKLKIDDIVDRVLKGRL